MPPTTGQNSIFQTSNRSAVPQFATRPLGMPKQAMNQVDLNTIDPNLRSYYEQFNQGLSQLDAQENYARDQGELARQNLVANYDRGAIANEQGRIQGLGRVRDTSADAQLQNRQRIRAIGGAPSSAVLELGNRLDRDTQRQVGGVNNQYMSQMGDLENTSMKAFGDIESELNKQIMEINNNRGLRLRERDAMIRQAQEDAARRAAAAAMYGNFGDTGGGNDNPPPPSPAVDDFAIAVDENSAGPSNFDRSLVEGIAKIAMPNQRRGLGTGFNPSGATGPALAGLGGGGRRRGGF